jgi:homocysteine S-methyltransferase
MDQELRVLRRKIEAGADFVLTQPVFEPERVEQTISGFEERYGPLGIPLIVGILPLYGLKHARFLHNEVPGISIPDVIQKRVGAAGDHAPQAGVSIAVEILGQLKDSVGGAYIMPPFGRYDMAAEIIETVGESVPSA